MSPSTGKLWIFILLEDKLLCVNVADVIAALFRPDSVSYIYTWFQLRDGCLFGMERHITLYAIAATYQEFNTLRWIKLYISMVW